MNLRTCIKRIPQTALLLALGAGHALRAEDGIANTVTVPARGLTMSAVEQSFGKPAEVLAAVGNPPITRWVYPAYTVYFDHQYVIHSVVPRPPKP